MDNPSVQVHFEGSRVIACVDLKSSSLTPVVTKADSILRLITNGRAGVRAAGAIDSAIPLRSLLNVQEKEELLLTGTLVAIGITIGTRKGTVRICMREVIWRSGDGAAVVVLVSMVRVVDRQGLLIFQLGRPGTEVFSGSGAHPL